MTCIVTHDLFDVHVLVCIVLNDIETAIDRGIKKQSYPYWLCYCLNRITVQIIGVGRNWICHKYKPESLWFV